MKMSSVLTALGIPYEQRERSSATWLTMDCPLCNDNEGHLGIVEDGRSFYCWRCGSQPLIETLCRLSSRSKKEVWEVVKQSDEGPADYTPRKKKQSASEVHLPAGTKEGLGPKHIEYMKQRGFKNPCKTAEIWGLKHTCISKDGWSWRIIFPFYSRSMEILAIQGRSISDENPIPYKTMDDELCVTPVKSLLYGEWLVPAKSVVVVEGTMDALKLGPGAVALCGKGWTSAQLLLLSRFNNRSILFDFDKRATGEAETLARVLGEMDGKFACYIQMNLSKTKATDPGSLTEKEGRAVMRGLV